VSHVILSFWYRIQQDPIRSKFLVPEKSGTRLHDTRAKFLVRDSGTSSGAENLGCVPSALHQTPEKWPWESFVWVEPSFFSAHTTIQPVHRTVSFET